MYSTPTLITIASRLTSPFKHNYQSINSQRCSSLPPSPQNAPGIWVWTTHALIHLPSSVLTRSSGLSMAGLSSRAAWMDGWRAGTSLGTTERLGTRHQWLRSVSDNTLCLLAGPPKFCSQDKNVAFFLENIVSLSGKIMKDCPRLILRMRINNLDSEVKGRRLYVIDCMSSKKKKDSKKGSSGGSGSSWPSPGSGVAAAPLPEPAKSRLWELFGAIEREFEQLHADNAACTFVIKTHRTANVVTD